MHKSFVRRVGMPAGAFFCQKNGPPVFVKRISVISAKFVYLLFAYGHMFVNTSFVLRVGMPAGAFVFSKKFGCPNSMPAILLLSEQVRIAY